MMKFPLISNKRPLHTLLLFITLLSNEALLSQSLSPRDSVDLLNTSASAKAEKFPDEAKGIVRESIDLASKADYNLGLAKAHYILGRIFYYQYKNKEAINAFEASLDVYKKLQDSTGISGALNGIGNIYKSRLDDINSALDYYQQANKYANTKRQQSVTLFNIATIYARIDKYEEAFKIYERVYKLSQEVNDPLQTANTLDAMGYVYRLQNDFLNAIKYYQQSIDLYQSLGASENHVRALGNLGYVYMGAKNFEEAEKALLSALTLSKTYKFEGQEINMLEKLSDVYFNKGDFKNCEQSLMSALDKAQATKINKFDEEIYKDLSELNKVLGRTELALKYQTKLLQITDSIKSEQDKKSLERMMRKSSNDNPEIIDDHYDYGGSLMLWILACVIVAGVALPIIYSKRKKNKKASKAANDITRETPIMDCTLQYIELVCGEGIKHESIQNIWWFQYESEERVYYAFVEKERYRVKQSMVELEPLLSKNFFRINRSAIINVNMLYNYSFWEHHKYILRMKDVNRTEFTIARNKLKELKELLVIKES